MSERSRRLYELDALRVLALGLLILYHLGMFYVSWDWHVKSPRLLPALEGPMSWLNPWRMSLLFVVSGAATAMMCERGASTRLFAHRSRRLLWPLLVGMLIIVPPQPYLEVVEKLGYTGSYLEFLKLYFSAYKGFCRGTDCLILPTWNHLWFLPYLWAYTLLVLVLHRFQWGQRLAWGHFLRGTRLLWLPLLPLWLWRMVLMPHFPSTHAFVDDFYNHALYGTMFVLGFFAFGSREDAHGLWAAACRLRWWALSAALMAFGLFAWGNAAYAADEEVPASALAALRFLRVCQQWLPIVAALGFARQHFSACGGPVWRWLSLAVFPVYILHQTVIVVAGHALALQRWPLWLEMSAVLALTLGVGLAGAWLAMRWRWLGMALGVEKRA